MTFVYRKHFDNKKTNNNQNLTGCGNKKSFLMLISNRKNISRILFEQTVVKKIITGQKIQKIKNIKIHRNKILVYINRFLYLEKL